MEQLLKTLAHHWALNHAQYLHLRLLMATSLGPVLGVLCLVFFTKWRRPGPAANSRIHLRVSRSGQLHS